MKKNAFFHKNTSKTSLYFLDKSAFLCYKLVFLSLNPGLSAILQVNLAQFLQITALQLVWKRDQGLISIALEGWMALRAQEMRQGGQNWLRGR